MEEQQTTVNENSAPRSFAAGRKEILWRDRKRTFLGLPWSFTIYSFDEERFYIQRGIFTIKRDQVRLYRILDISMVQTFGQRLFGLGTITVCSGDKSLGDFEIKSIKNPDDVMEQLSELVEKERDRKRVSSREFIHDGADHDEAFEDYD